MIYEGTTAENGRFSVTTGFLDEFADGRLTKFSSAALVSRQPINSEIYYYVIRKISHRIYAYIQLKLLIYNLYSILKYKLEIFRLRIGN